MIDEFLKVEQTYRHWTADVLRFGDSDLFGHINTASYVTYCDTARLVFATEMGLAGQHLETAAMVARTTVNILTELFPPGTIKVGTAILAIGRTSFTLAQGIFHDGRCAAVSDTVLVRFSRRTRRPVELDSESRERLRSHLIVRPLAT